MDKKSYLRAGEVADILGVDRSTVFNLRKSGEGPIYVLTPGGHARYSREEFYAWLAEFRGERVA